MLTLGPNLVDANPFLQVVWLNGALAHLSSMAGEAHAQFHEVLATHCT